MPLIQITIDTTKPEELAQIAAVIAALQGPVPPVVAKPAKKSKPVEPIGGNPDEPAQPAAAPAAAAPAAAAPAAAAPATTISAELDKLLSANKPPSAEVCAEIARRVAAGETFTVNKAALGNAVLALSKVKGREVAVVALRTAKGLPADHDTLVKVSELDEAQHSTLAELIITAFKQ